MTVGVMMGGRGRDWTKLNLSTRSPVKVIAGEDLHRGASASFLLKEVTRILLTQEGFKIPSEGTPCKEIKMRNNYLVAACLGSPSSPSSWLSDLLLAEDVHSESGRLDIASETFIGSDPLLVLTLTKAVKKGELLSFWFSSELAAKLGFPFLNFSHIKDGQYFCSKCTRKFNAPNPLKLHIATSCETLDPGSLWSRLEDRRSSMFSPWTFPSFTNGSSRLEENFLTSIEKKAKQLSPDSTSSNQQRKDTKRRTCGLNQRPSNILLQGKSAFRPVSSSSHNSSRPYPCHELSTPPHPTDDLNIFSQNTLQGMFTFHPLNLNAMPLASLAVNPLLASSSLNYLKWPPLPTSAPPSGTRSPHVKPTVNSPHPLFDSLPSTSSCDPYAEVETLVSSLGRGKGTHLCLYCGKVYSRKYGLKIHIRTHTGYKPLKCRVCLRPFGDPSNLNKHVRLHAQGDTPYRCDLCGKVLVRKRDLDRHLRSRHSREADDILKDSSFDTTEPEEEEDEEDLEVDVEGPNDQRSPFEEADFEMEAAQKL